MNLSEGLEKAILENNFKELRKIIQNNKNIDMYGGFKINGESYNVLWIAIKYNRKEVLDYLIQKFYRKNIDWQAMLIYTANIGNIAMFDHFVKRYRCDPRFRDDLALQLAAENGHIAMVDYLIKRYGCDPKVDNNRALFLAASNGHIAMVDHLVEKYRCDPRIINDDILCSAAWRGQIKMIEHLIKKHGCNPYTCDVLLYAVMGNHIALVDLLIERYGCNPHKNNEEAVKNAIEYGHLEMIEHLVTKYNCDISKAISKDLLKKVVSGDLTKIIDLLAEKYNVDFNITCFSYVSDETLAHLIVRRGYNNFMNLPEARIQNIYNSLNDDSDKIKYIITVSEYFKGSYFGQFLEKELDRLTSEIRKNKSKEMEI